MYLFFGAVALLHIPLTSSNQKTPQQSLSGGQYSLLTIMILVLLVLLARIYAYWSADVHYSSAKTLLNSGEYQRGIAQMEQAISLSPKEALFYDTFSAELAQLSVALAQQGDATTAAQVAQTAISMSDTALTLNSAHLNFYKTRTRMFITLSQLEPNLLLQAKETLLAGIQRAPNDPKLFYNLAIVESTLGNEEEGLALLEKTIDLKPDYLAARLQLGKAYARAEKTTAAQSQFAFILENIDPQNQSALDELQLLEANN